MGRAKVVNYYNERFCGNMSAEQCDILEHLIELDAENGSVCDLTHIIYDLDDADVLSIIEDYELFNCAMHEYNMKRGRLLNYQTVAVCFMYWANRCILGDSVGMGKTVATAGVCNLIKVNMADQGRTHRYLVLTEKNLAVQFRNEMVKFTGEFVQLLPDGEARSINKFKNRNPFDCVLEHSVVGTHSLLTVGGFISWLELCRTSGCGFPFDTLIIDESSDIGVKSTTQMATSFKNLSKYFRNIYFLNATPFETHLSVFYNQLNLLDPHLLPTKQNFEKTYCIMNYRGMYARPTGKYKNQEQFKGLIRYRYFARTRKDKGAKMSDCKGGVVYSVLSKVQQDLLRKSQLHRMVYDCPSHIDPSIEFNSTNVPKLASLDNLLKCECSEADTIIIFVQFKEAQKQLSQWLTNKGYPNRVLNGDTPNDKRQAIIQGFKNCEFRVLLTNVQKGLNFGNCDYCIFYSFDPNPSHMVQFEGRITRDFDITGKNIYIMCSLGKEKETLEKVVASRAKATTQFTNTDYSVILDILLKRGIGNNDSDTEE